MNLDRLSHRLVAVLGGAPPLPERERRHLEEIEILLRRLDQDDVAFEVGIVLVLPEAELEPRMQQRAEHLVQDGQHATIGELNALGHVVVLLRIVLADDAVRERAERVVADDEIGTVVDRDVDVGGASHATVHVVDPANARRPIEAWQRRRRLHRLGDGKGAVFVVAEDDALGRIEVHGDDVELALACLEERLEVVRHVPALEIVAQIVLDGGVVEEAGRQVVEREGKRASRQQGLTDGPRYFGRGRERRGAHEVAHGLGDAFRECRALGDEIEDRSRDERGEVEQIADRTLDELRVVGLVEIERPELRELFGAAFQAPQHLRRRDAARERRGQECTSGKADVDVEVGRLPIHEEVVEGLQPAELEAAAADGSSCKHERDARIALPNGEVALLDDRYAHVTPPYGAQLRS